MEYQYGQNGGGMNQYTYYQGGMPEMPEKKPTKKEKKKSGRGILPLCLILSLFTGLAGGALGAGGAVYYMEKKTEAVVQAAEEPQKTETLQEAAPAQPTASYAGQLSVAEITKKCLPSIVAITNKGETEIRSLWGTFIQESESSGSGVIIGETDKELLILTNYHVVSGNETLSVLFSYQDNMEDPEIASAKIKDYDANRDLAVIAIDKSELSQETMGNIGIAALGNSDALDLGEQVVAIGNALGYGQSVTTGIVSALGRSVATQRYSDGTVIDNEYIQTDAAISPGNSGGALLNMRGELVGINTAKVSNMMVEGAEGIGYAIPISDVSEDIRNMMNRETRDLVSEESRGYLGITGTNVTTEINQAYDIPVGAYISGVNEASPAEKAGLERGMVITEIEGKKIYSTEELRDVLDYYKAGETVSLTVQVRTENGYEERTVEVKLILASEVQG